jgi:Fe-S cluster assembly protein SufD
MVTEIAKSEDIYQSAHRSLNETGSAWVDLLRNGAMDRFETLGFPTVHQEEWKYTNLAGLAKAAFPPATKVDQTHNAVSTFSETANSHVVLVDGFFREDLSSRGALDQVVVLDLFTAISHEVYGKIVSDHLARNAPYHDNATSALNTAMLQSGVFVLIPKNVKLDAPLQITYVSEQTERASFPRTLIVSETNSSAVVVENFMSAGESRSFVNAVTEIVLQEGAQLRHYRLQSENLNTTHISNTAAELGRGSSFNTTSINLGGQLARHDVSVVMQDEGAECWVDGLYLIGPNQHTDTHSTIDHKQPHCKSHQLYKGILDGNARAVFNGKVFVREGAQKTDAMQTNKNLLLSTQARVDTKPQLEIYADDVKCAHGAAVGQIDEDELFYLQARGINPDLGRSLLTYGFAEELIGKIELESIRSELDRIVLNRLHSNIEG